MNQLMMKAKHKEEDEISILQTLSAKKKRLKILSAVNVCNVAFFYGPTAHLEQLTRSD